MPRLRLTLAYVGTRYAGWQLQARGDGAGTPTVQAALETAFARVLGRRFPVSAAGRTDAGVHAEGQVCHVDVPENKEHIDWQRALNVNLPPDIRVLSARGTGPDFHARKNATGKRYIYSLWMHRDRALPRLDPFVWSVPVLDCRRLAEALPFLTGRRDFASFRNSGTPGDDTIRDLHSISLLPGHAGLLACPSDWPVLSLVFEGAGFLKQMARNLAGLLVWVGLGKLKAERIPGILEAKDRRALPSPCAAARGLTLARVFYSA
jgi:tRNA pseudouridine38-40 synthase